MISATDSSFTGPRRMRTDGRVGHRPLVPVPVAGRTRPSDPAFGTRSRDSVAAVPAGADLEGREFARRRGPRLVHPIDERRGRPDAERLDELMQCRGAAFRDN